MIKKISALLLALLMCVAMVACSNDGAPDGMKKVTLEGEPFILYVPESWTDNCSSGISSAFYSNMDNILVTARYFTPSSEKSLDEHVNALSDSYAATLPLFALVSREAAVLGGENAVQLVYTADVNGRSYTYRQLIALYNGDVVLLTFYCPTDRYETQNEQFSSIAEVFVLCDKGEVKNDCVTDKKTPAGMKIASGDYVQYRLYVPTSWVCDSESGVSEAYYPTSGKPNVTVTAYAPEGDMNAEQYFATCETEYKQKISGYELVSTADRTVADRAAKCYTYRAKYGEAEFTVMQTVLEYNDMIYSITYTALTGSFDTYLGDVNTMLDSFIFR